MTWLGRFEKIEENFDPSIHRPIALELFCSRTGLHLRPEDLDIDLVREFYEPPRSINTGRMRPEGWSDGQGWEFLQEGAIFDYLRAYWVDKNAEASGDYGAPLPTTTDVNRDIKNLIGALEIMTELDRPNRDLSLWRFPGSIVTQCEHPFDAPYIQEMNWLGNESSSSNGARLWPCDTNQVVTALLLETIERKMKEREIIRRYRSTYPGRPTDDWARKLLVARLRSVRKGRFAVPVYASELWPESDSNPEDKLVGTTLPSSAFTPSLERFVVRMDSEKPREDAFLSHHDITLLLVSAGILRPATNTAFYHQSDEYAEQVKNDWRTVTRLTRQGNPLTRRLPFTEYSGQEDCDPGDND